MYPAFFFFYLLGFLSTLSSEASVFTLTTITLDRYFSIVHPLTLKERTLRVAVGVMCGTWTLAATLALLPLLGLSYYGHNFYGSNGMCLPLHIHDPYAKVNTRCSLYMTNSGYIVLARPIQTKLRIYFILWYACVCGGEWKSKITSLQHCSLINILFWLTPHYCIQSQEHFFD